MCCVLRRQSLTPSCAVSLKEHLGPAWLDWMMYRSHYSSGRCAPSFHCTCGNSFPKYWSCVKASATQQPSVFTCVVDWCCWEMLTWLVDGENLQVDAAVWVQPWCDLHLAAAAVGCGPSLWTHAKVTRNAASIYLAFAWKSDFWKSDKRKVKGFTENPQIPQFGFIGCITDLS